MAPDAVARPGGRGHQGLSAYVARTLGESRLSVVTVGVALSFPFLIAALEAPGLWTVSLCVTLATVAGLAYARTKRRVAHQVLRVAYEDVAAGRLDDADVALDIAARLAPRGPVRRYERMLRAVTAVRRGALDVASSVLDDLVRRAARARDSGARPELTAARSMRAFVRAALGQREGAEEDIAATRADEAATADDLARAALAEVLVAERTKGRAALRELLSRHRDLLYEHTHPRERALVRALDRMTRTASASVYRARADADRADVGGDEPPLGEWVARIVPEAVPYLAPTHAGTVDQSPAVTAPYVTANGLAAVQVARQRGLWASRRAWWARMGTAAAVVVLGAVVTSLALKWGADVSPSIAASGWSGSGVWLGGSLALAVMAGRRFARSRLRGHRDLAPLGRALRRLSRGHVHEAVDQLSELTRSDSDVIAAQAHLTLATVAERRGDWAQVLRHCDASLDHLQDDKVREAAGLVYPDTVSLRALALSARGAAEEARTEVALLPFGYPHLRLALFRTRLVELARVGAIDEAAAWVEGHAADLPLTSREEMLADLVRAARSAERVGAAELSRLRVEATTEPMAGWLRSVAGPVLDRFATLAAPPPADRDEATARPSPLAPRVEVPAELDPREAARAELEALDEERAVLELEADAAPLRRV